MMGMRIDLDDIADPAADADIVRGHADVPADRSGAAGASDSDMRRGSDSHGRVHPGDETQRGSSSEQDAGTGRE
jgi:hypothetical protein